MSIAERVDKALRAAGLAITGVSIPEPLNRATWHVHPAALQSAAQPIIDAFVLPTTADDVAECAEREVGERKMQAVALALWECIPSPKLTRAQLRARAVEIYKTL